MVQHLDKKADGANSKKMTGQDRWNRHSATQVDLLIALLLLASAILARWPFILVGETLLHSDEAIVGCMGQDIAAGLRFPLYFYGQSYMGALEAYTIAALRSVIEDPLISLRLAPAVFFGLLTATQYLLLTSWFGRIPALLGAISLIATPPALMQWSIAPRGGYIEVLLWATLIWMTYSQSFADQTTENLQGPTCSLGLLIGSGLWINPTIIVLSLPIAIHFFLNNPLAAMREKQPGKFVFRLLDALFGRLSLQLVILMLLGFFLLTCLWTVKIDAEGVRHVFFFDRLRPPVSYAALSFIALLTIFSVYYCRGLLSRWHVYIRKMAPFILGLFVGYLPGLLYTFSRMLAGLPGEDSLPLGPRALWEVSATLEYLYRGLPVLFGADASPYLILAEMGRVVVTRPISQQMSIVLSLANYGLLIILVLFLGVLIKNYKREIQSVLRLKPGKYSPFIFLLTGLFGFLCFYLMSGAAINFTSIRYLVPIWIFIPGLLAASASIKKLRPALTLLLLLWAGGQVVMYNRLGAPHPLRPLADELKKSQKGLIFAEQFDCHLLRFLTEQQVPIAEYDPFWPRFEHVRPNRLASDQPAVYLVQASDTDWRQAWFEAGFPGSPPIETTRSLYPRLKTLEAKGDLKVLKKKSLNIQNYEIWTLAAPLPEPNRE